MLSSYAVLIVAGDLTFQTACVQILRAQKQFVVTAADCRDALLFSGEFQLDAIACEVRSVDDWQCCRLIKQRSRSAHVPLIVALSASMADRWGEALEPLGCAAVILEPYSASVLVDLIGRVAGGERGIAPL